MFFILSLRIDERDECFYTFDAIGKSDHSLIMKDNVDCMYMVDEDI